MKVLPDEIGYLLSQMPYASEIYNKEGQLMGINDSWKLLFEYDKKSLPKLNIKDNKLLIKAGVADKLKLLFEKGGNIKTVPVLYEKGDLSFTNLKKDMIFKFYLKTIHEPNGNILYIINLIENITEELKQAESEKELEVQRRNAKVILEILEDERKRVAKELHDVIGQKILLAKLNIELFQKRFGDKHVELEDSISQLIDISKEIKSVIHSLHPIVIEKYGLIDSLDLLIHEFNTATGYNTTIKYFGNPEYDNIRIDLNIYRILQEALNNIAKHSKAENVEIEIHFTVEMIICSVSDDGIGFDPSEAVSSVSNIYNYGLISMKERAKVFRGELSIESQIGKGTKIFFQIPTRNINK